MLLNLLATSKNSIKERGVGVQPTYLVKFHSNGIWSGQDAKSLTQEGAK